jgi:histidinol-phosphatase (PHP family)
MKKCSEKERRSALIADYHVHTYYSDDSDYPMEQVVQDAIRLSLDEIAITDHVDYGVKPDHSEIINMSFPDGEMPKLNVDYPKWDEELTKLQGKYTDQITIRRGMEFGIQEETIDKYESLFHRYPFDFILLSCHEVGNQEFWTGEFQKGRSQLEYNLAYYEAIYHCMQKYKDYSVLAHLDLIARYDPLGPIDFSKIRDIIAAILELAIWDDKGIELNTSSHRYGLKDLEPSRDILRLYRDLGGRIITIGSDSHKPEHLGAYIRESHTELRKLGFREFCTYEQMEPTFHKLEDN